MVSLWQGNTGRSRGESGRGDVRKAGRISNGRRKTEAVGGQGRAEKQQDFDVIRMRDVSWSVGDPERVERKYPGAFVWLWRLFAVP